MNAVDISGTSLASAFEKVDEAIRQADKLARDNRLSYEDKTNLIWETMGKVIQEQKVLQIENLNKFLSSS